MPLSIKQIQQKIAEQYKIDARQQSIADGVAQLREQLSNIQSQIDQLLDTLQNLEKLGVKSFFALAKGQRKSDLEGTRKKYHALVLKQKALQHELELLDYESTVLASGSISMKDLKQELTKALKFKELNLIKIDKGFSSGLFKIDKDIAKKKNSTYHLHTIHTDGAQAIKLLKQTIKILDTARNASIREMSGAGESSNFKKKKFAEKAKIKGHNAAGALERFYDRYCGMYRSEKAVNRIPEFMLFIDTFLSRLVSDSEVHYRNKNCSEHLHYNLQSVESALEKLNTDIKHLEEEMQRLRKARGEYIAEF